ncbi:isoprenylcysteine carboxyl methyltransferase [Amylocarpus encephaloides]|uniref:Protein-S-isoprenylcysteine O-methyltransferase n=1 Tax=Amylocarpus encephaloides TaxID=45428 RepID=A0A9P8C6X0_9HELO|nr:isoprenylcysteine carboxyl methyltransferase [Amylocarpus encephaloides]
MSSFERISLALSIFVSAMLSYKCYIPPNTVPTKSDYPEGRIIWFSLILMLYTLQMAIILFPSHRSNFCAHPEGLNEELFRWSSWRTLTYLGLVWICAPLRIGAFSGLGENFTFVVTQPKKLVTTGVYSWIQHPSYTGVIGLRVADTILLQRADGVGACVLPESVARIPWLSDTVGALLMVPILMVAFVRVREEEKVLKDTFGREWETWHARTRRFVPGLF